MVNNSKILEKKMVKTAIGTLKNSHSPYSKFKVGAAILTKSGNIFNGTNVEFDAFSLTVCAERSALFNAVSNGDKKIVAIAIATSSDHFLYPCGMCRQALIEFNPNMRIILINNKQKEKKVKLKDILPNHFKL